MPDEEKRTSFIETTENQIKINKILDKMRIIQNNRTALEKQWHVNTAFLLGHQHFSIERKGSSLGDRIWFALNRLEQSRKLRRTSNKILVSFRSLLARMLERKARVVVDPETRIARDIDSAKISEEVLEDFWKRVNRNNPRLATKIPGMMMVQKYLYTFILNFGKAWLHPYFNEHTESKTILKSETNNNEAIVKAEIGEVETLVKSPINTFIDHLGEYLIDREVVSVERVKRDYNIVVEPEKIERSDLEEQVLRLIEKTDFNGIQNGTNLFKYYELPSDKYRNGRFMVFTQKKLILEGELPEEYKGRLPYVEFNWLDILMTANSQGLVEQLIPLQKDYNFTISRIAEYKKYLAGKLLVKDGSNLQTKWTDETGQIIKYRGQTAPGYTTPPNPPSFLFEDLARINFDMQDLAMAHDASIGRVPRGVKSGVALQELQEQDDSTLAPTIIEIEEKLAYFSEMVLDIVAVKYTQDRILAITGNEDEKEVKTFLGFETVGNRRITVSLGSSLPGTRQARQSFISGLLEANIVTPEEAKSLLQIGDIEGALDDVDKRAQESEIDEMLRGGIVDVNKWDIHQKHAEVLRKFMAEPKFNDLSDRVKANLIAHWERHLQEIAQEVNPNENTEPQEEVIPTEGGQAIVQPLT